MGGGLRFSVLGSSSSGNSVVVTDGETMILVDAGLPSGYIVSRLEEMGLEGGIKGIFISHEHSDHIRSVGSLAALFSCPIYLSTSVSWYLKMDNGMNVIQLRNGKRTQVGGLDIMPFVVPHDALDPFGFIIRGGGGSLGIVTDLGSVNEEILERLRDLGGLVVESNHDRDMLLRGSYPYPLKQRIMDDRGHLSNRQCADLLVRIIGPSTREVVLAHLSEENNDPLRAYETVMGALEGLEYEVNLSLSYPRVPTPLFDLFDGRVPNREDG